jgi:hypothetical protein
VGPDPGGPTCRTLGDAFAHAWNSGTVSDENVLRNETAVGMRLDNARRDAVEGRPPPAAR